MPPEPKTFEYEHEGTTLTIPIPEGYKSKEEIAEGFVEKGYFESEVARRTKSAAEGRFKLEEVLDNKDFITRLASERREQTLAALGIDPEKLEQVDIGKIREEITQLVRKEEVDPLTEQLTTSHADVALLRQRDLDAQVAEAGIALRVEPDLLPLVGKYMMDFMVWSDEHKDWIRKKEDGTEGFEFSRTSDDGKRHAYMRAGEVLAQLKTGGKNKNWFSSTVQDGINHKDGPPGETGDVTLDAFKKMNDTQRMEVYHSNPDLYRKHMDTIREGAVQELFKDKTFAVTT